MDIADSFGQSIVRFMIRHPKLMVGVAIIAAISGFGSHNAATNAEDHPAPPQAIQQTVPQPAPQNAPSPQAQTPAAQAPTQTQAPKTAEKQDLPASAATSQDADKAPKKRMIDKTRWVVDEPGWTEKVPLGDYIVFSDGWTFKVSEADKAEEHRQLALKFGRELTSEIKTDYRDEIHIEKGHWEHYQVPAED